MNCRRHWTTYNRILLEIPDQYRYEAQVLFSLLAFSTRPISLSEAAEAVAIDLKKGTFDLQNRLFDPGSILKICSALVSISHYYEELRFAHYSIKEYLLSKRAPPVF